MSPSTPGHRARSGRAWDGSGTATRPSSARANGWAPFTHGQYKYSLIDREIEQDVIPMMRQYGIGLTAWSPLGSGFLSGKYTRENLTSPDHRLHSAIGMLRFDPEAFFGAERLDVDLARHDVLFPICVRLRDPD